MKGTTGFMPFRYHRASILLDHHFHRILEDLAHGRVVLREAAEISHRCRRHHPSTPHTAQHSCHVALLPHMPHGILERESVRSVSSSYRSLRRSHPPFSVTCSQSLETSSHSTICLVRHSVGSFHAESFRLFLKATGKRLSLLCCFSFHQIN